MQWKGTSTFEFKGKSMETDTTRSEFSSGRKAMAEQKLGSEEIYPGLWELQSDNWAGVWDIVVWQSFPGILVPPEQVNQSLWWKWNSPKTNILAYGLIDRISTVLKETASKYVHKEEDGDW